MKRPRIVPITVAVLAAALLAGCSSVGGTAATVNGERFSQHDLDAELRAQRDNAAYWNASQQGAASPADTVPAALTANWVTRHIYMMIMEDSAVGRRAKPDAALLSEVAARLAQVQGWDQFPKWFQDRLIDTDAERIAVQDAYTRTPARPSEEELRAFYARYAAKLCASGKVVSHILVKTEAEAAAIAAQLRAGADFATIAKAQSLDTGSATQGGALGCLGAQQLVQEFQTAADALPVGGTSGPVQTEYGWHIIRVEAAAYDALATDVQQAYTQVRDVAFQQWVTRQAARSKVSVNPQYGTWRKTQGAYKVVPPKAPAPAVRPTSPPTGATGTAGSRGTTP